MTLKKPSHVIHEEDMTSHIVVILGILSLVMMLTHVLLFGLQTKLIISLATCCLMFLLTYSARITVWTDRIHISYGVGAISRTVDFSAIEAFHIVSNDSPFSRLYRPMQPLVMELSTDKNRRVRVPTQDPNILSTILARLTEKKE